MFNGSPRRRINPFRETGDYDTKTHIGSSKMHGVARLLFYINFRELSIGSNAFTLPRTNSREADAILTTRMPGDFTSSNSAELSIVKSGFQFRT